VTDEQTEDIGDIDPDDVHDADDHTIDFSNVDAVQEQVDAINAVEDEDERTSAAARWAKELAGEEIG
jgi:RPA family protein